MSTGNRARVIEEQSPTAQTAVSLHTFSGAGSVGAGPGLHDLEVREFSNTQVVEYSEGRSDGYTAGYSAGLAEGRETCRADAAVALQALAAAVVRDVEHVETVAVALAVELAEVIIGREVSAGNTIASDAVSSRIVAQNSHEGVMLRMCSAEIAAFEGLLPAGVQLVADETMARGQVQADIAGSFADLSIDTAVARMRSRLQLGGSPGPVRTVLEGSDQ